MSRYMNLRGPLHLGSNRKITALLEFRVTLLFHPVSQRPSSS